MTITVTVSMPEMLRTFMEYRVRVGGYGSSSEYIRELIRIDERLEIARLDAAAERKTDREQAWHSGTNYRP